MEFKDNQINPYLNLSRGKILSLIKKELTPAQILYGSKEELVEMLLNEQKEEFIERYKRLKNQTVKEKLKEIFDFVGLYSKQTNNKKAIMNLQAGLNILNGKYKENLLEDGIYGNITKSCLENTCRYYNSRIIKKYILKAILTSIIFETKNNRNIDTNKLVEETIKNMEGKI